MGQGCMCQTKEPPSPTTYQLWDTGQTAQPVFTLGLFWGLSEIICVKLSAPCHMVSSQKIAIGTDCWLGCVIQSPVISAGRTKVVFIPHSEFLRHINHRKGYALSWWLPNSMNQIVLFFSFLCWKWKFRSKFCLRQKSHLIWLPVWSEKVTFLVSGGLSSLKADANKFPLGYLKQES